MEISSKRIEKELQGKEKWTVFLCDIHNFSSSSQAFSTKAGIERIEHKKQQETRTICYWAWAREVKIMACLRFEAEYINIYSSPQVDP